MRPGHASETIASITNVVAGDHYDVIYLGQNPRSFEWVKFVESAVQAQLPNYPSIPQDVRDLVIALSRDSLRTALELFARYLSSKGASAKHNLIEAIVDLRDNQILGAQRTLQNYHPDFQKMIKDIREEAIRLNGRITGPLYLSFELQRTFFDTPSRLSRFIQLGLRSGSFCMPEGKRWIPGHCPDEVELTPILSWDKGDDYWVIESESPIKISRKETDIFRPKGGPKNPATIFVAYRMGFEESKRFRIDLERYIKDHPNPNAIDLRIGTGYNRT